MNEDIKKYIKSEYNKALNAKEFVDDYCRVELSRIYKEFETADVDRMIFLQSELKIIKGLQNKLNNIIIKQESINSYDNKLK